MTGLLSASSRLAAQAYVAPAPQTRGPARPLTVETQTVREDPKPSSGERTGGAGGSRGADGIRLDLSPDALAVLARSEQDDNPVPGDRPDTANLPVPAADESDANGDVSESDGVPVRAQILREAPFAGQRDAVQRSAPPGSALDLTI